ncbi:hypothetical protein COCOBI_08-0840 [Coccomyxa sp. Obi]|nr:hypothetical protein COCOBI_08-0840 [Coccomyxa sp. Obi]
MLPAARAIAVLSAATLCVGLLTSADTANNNPLREPWAASANELALHEGQDGHSISTADRYVLEARLWLALEREVDGPDLAALVAGLGNSAHVDYSDINYVAGGQVDE